MYKNVKANYLVSILHDSVILNIDKISSFFNGTTYDLSI